jgi:ABC-type glycerol-3-phosphate transport system substrate-binding protein
MRAWLSRLTALSSVLALLAIMVWNPGEAPAPADGKIHLRYWMIVGMKEFIPYYVRSFNASQARIVAETTPIPWQEHEKKILTAILSGDPPDVVNQVTPVPKWAARMALMPLDEYIRRDGFDTTMFFPSLWEEMRWQGRIFAVPVTSASYALFHNRRLFREAGLDPEQPPATWEEVWDMNRRLVARDEQGRITRMGFIPNYGNLQTSLLMAWQLGGTFLNDGGTRVSLDNPAMVAGLEWLVRFYDAYPLKDVAAFMAGFGFADQHPFIAGKVAMVVLDSSFPDQIKAYRPDLDYGVSVIPTFPGRQTASSSGSWWVAIPRGAKNPEAAWEFIKHMVSKESQLEEIEMTEESLFPANRLAALDPRFLKGREREIFVRQMEHAFSPSIVPLAHDVFWRELMGAQERVVYRLQQPQEALRQGERVVQSVLEEALAYDRYVRTKMSH